MRIARALTLPLLLAALLAGCGDDNQPNATGQANATATPKSTPAEFEVTDRAGNVAQVSFPRAYDDSDNLGNVRVMASAEAAACQGRRVLSSTEISDGGGWMRGLIVHCGDALVDGR